MVIKFQAFVFAVLISFPIFGQSTVYGIKGGPLIGIQNWNNSQRGPLLSGHVIVSAETWSEEDLNSLFAQLGYHNRGSSIRQLFINPNTGFNPQSRAFVFSNVGLTVGAKRRIRAGTWSPFYSVGIRGEYTIRTNLDEFQDDNFTAPTAYPLNEFVEPWNYGLYAGGGTELRLTEYIGAVFELSVNPDLSRQYFQPPLNNVSIYNPWTGQTITSLRERTIRNVTLEFTVGLRFLRKVVYID
ncbi:hypothetical protein [Portibacter marinus]|uniref:hypothetical protein n=1 Tax=Portibacter marinus TaxID=2898660 RepID=UPI001F40096F|nr:hypothetical protein [Portibacter marinus]